MLLRQRGYRVRLTVVLHQEVRRHAHPARRSANHMAKIAETVVIGISGDGRIEPHAVRGQ